MCVLNQKLEPTKPLHRDLKLPKVRYPLTLNTCQYVQAHMIGKLPQSFSEYFKEMRNQHNYKTRGSTE